MIAPLAVDPQPWSTLREQQIVNKINELIAVLNSRSPVPLAHKEIECTRRCYTGVAGDDGEPQFSFETFGRSETDSLKEIRNRR